MFHFAPGGTTMIARVHNCKQYFDTLAERFVPEAAKGVNATYQYELEGTGGGTWTVAVHDGTFEVSEGATANPTVVYKMNADNYVKMVNGDLSGTKAFLTRKLKVSGSIPLAQKMNTFLPPRS
jgi:putative sterol carrier protein